MYATAAPNGQSSEGAMIAYCEFLRDLKWFESGLRAVVSRWPISCEQFLNNASINRIAWLGQSSMCIATGIPACFRSGFARLTDREQVKANAMAARYLKRWLRGHSGRPSEAAGPIPRGMQARIGHYVATWKRRDYPNDIPEEVPSELQRLNFAPSYRAIATAILKNDHHLTSLGYGAPVSPWYNELKRIEIEARTNGQNEDTPSSI